jgi:aminocarboxymuconate-semialdehyde decarboxylase
VPNRRAFLRNLAGATAGMVVGGRGLGDTALGAVQAPARRRAMVGGRRITVIDIHAHIFVPEVWELVQNTPLAAQAKNNIGGTGAGIPGTIALNAAGQAARLQYMDKEGIDYQALSVNAWGYAAERALARDLIQLQNEKIAQAVAAHPDRFVGLATLALQHPDLAAEQLDVAVRKLGLRGAAIGGSVEGMELSDRRFDPFWAKANELGVMLFMHPQQAQGTTVNPRLGGKGGLGNTIGNPLETTVFLSHLIFEGTLDRYPNLKICGAHAGGYLASYSGRSDALCARGAGDDCRALKRKPSEYFRQHLYIDSMIFHESGLRHLVDEVGASHIFYGTDYPFDWPVGIDFVLNARFLSDADKEAILGGNLLKTLRITS